MWTFIIITAICIFIALRLSINNFYWTLIDIFISFLFMCLGAVIGIVISFGVAVLIPGEYETK